MYYYYLYYIYILYVFLLLIKLKRCKGPCFKKEFISKREEHFLFSYLIFIHGQIKHRKTYFKGMTLKIPFLIFCCNS